jgi:hypothetical protein
MVQSYKNYFNLPNNLTTKCDLIENCKVEITIYVFFTFLFGYFKKKYILQYMQIINKKKMTPTFVSVTCLEITAHIFVSKFNRPFSSFC